MFIERGMHQKHKSPRGATGTICLNHGLKRIQSKTRKDTLPHLAPEGRHVYSTRHAPKTQKPQRGDRSHLSQSQIQSGFKAK